MRYFPLLLLFIFAACQPNNTAEVDGETIPRRPKPTKPLPPAAPVADSKPVDAAWVDCWSKFKEGMEKDSRPYMLSVINFPVTGANLVCDKIYNEESDSREFGDNMFTIFDQTVKDEVLKKAPSDILSYSLTGNAYHASPAKKYNISQGARIYKFSVRRITGTSSGSNAVVADNFYFAKFNGNYKLAWIDLEQL